MYQKLRKIGKIKDWKNIRDTFTKTWDIAESNNSKRGTRTSPLYGSTVLYFYCTSKIK